MKIAFITDDEKTISRHFGRASYYLVIEVEDGEEIKRDLRNKLGHRQFIGEEQPHELGQLHGMSKESHSKHGQMAEAINDCDALICGGMGMGAYQSMQSFGITPIVTEISNIEEALQAYLDGDLQDQREMLH